MIRTGIAATALTAGLITWVVAPAQAGRNAVQAATQATAADAAPFVGEWTLNLEGPNGPSVFNLVIKTEADKIVGEIKSEQMAPTPITDITTSDKGLVLKRTPSTTRATRSARSPRLRPALTARRAPRSTSQTEPTSRPAPR